MRARLDGRERRKLFIEAEAHHGDLLVATCKAIYITVDPAQFRGRPRPSLSHYGRVPFRDAGESARVSGGRGRRRADHRRVHQPVARVGRTRPGRAGERATPSSPPVSATHCAP